MFRFALTAAIAAAVTSPAFAQTPDLSGRWSGYWVSDKSGHTGPLHAKFIPLDAETYRVRYHGRFAKIIPFVYSTKMHIVGSANIPQLYVDVDRIKAAALGVSIDDINNTLSIYLAEVSYRNKQEELNLLKIRNSAGQMVPLSTLVTLREVSGPDGVVVLSASENLPFFGAFQTTAVATATNFDAAFTSKSDSGRFVLTRRR